MTDTANTQPSDRTDSTEIIVDPDLPLVRLIRTFDAPPSKVFRAYTDPDLYRQWIGPRDRRADIVNWDCRDGGSYRYLIVSEGFEAGFRGSFHTVRPDELIVQTFSFEGYPDSIALERAVFEDLGDGRTRVTGTSLVDSFEARDAFVASGMESGVREGYLKLDDLLARS